MDKDLSFGLIIGAGNAMRAQENALVRGGDAHMRTVEVALGLKAQLMQAQNRIAELEDALAIAKAGEAGRHAQFAALKDENPNCPLLGNSGRTFTDGAPKTKIRLIFEAAFDATARQLGIASPATRRED